MENSLKKFLAVFFVAVLFIGFIRNGAYLQLQNLAQYLKQDTKALEEGSLTIDGIEAEFSEGLFNQRELINVNGYMAKKLHMQGFYSDMGMYITDDLYIVSASQKTSTDYEYEQTMAFKQFLDENGINLLYVNEPTKYIEDSLFRNEFGVETYSNRNMDLFLSRIRNEGVNVIDLRDCIEEGGINISDLFYRTDHHWTTRAGLWAAEKISEGLNTYCGYNINPALYDESNYTFTNWQECWLGEQGRKIAQSYVGLDDYTEIKPNFNTNYTFKSDEGCYDGTFDNFINEGVYNTENDVYENISWHYAYSQINCINNNVPDGKVLVLGDSYEQVTEPFISLGVHEVDSLILRNYDSSFNLRNYILENGYDTVIIAYAQFMVGVHDDESSANYRMFTFE